MSYYDLLFNLPNKYYLRRWELSPDEWRYRSDLLRRFSLCKLLSRPKLGKPRWAIGFTLFVNFLFAWREAFTDADVRMSYIADILTSCRSLESWCLHVQEPFYQMLVKLSLSRLTHWILPSELFNFHSLELDCKSYTLSLIIRLTFFHTPRMYIVQ